ncbi:MAG TPA: tetratricopeptide repeat protein [Thermoanaerobaculia bacterium]|nr:tetratricopeptide repeat protein [Thermoanaerobaculia bacterium]
MIRPATISAILLCLLAAGCRTSTDGTVAIGAAPEAISLSGRPLHRTPLPPETAATREAQLQQARLAAEANPDDPDALIWLGRRTAYLGRYREAIEIFSEGIERFPDDPRFYRHRGHRWITVRQLDRAVDDLRRAAQLIEGKPDQIEPDGLPNARNIPTSTLQSNIWYHLGLALYLRGDFPEALEAYRRGMEVSRNPDGLVSMSYWHYLTLRRLGQGEEAAALLDPIGPDLDVIENQAYYRLLRMFRGEESVETLVGEEKSTLDDATIGYGVGAWHLVNGNVPRARTIFERIVASSEWAAFGFIAAEAELSRRNR